MVPAREHLSTDEIALVQPAALLADALLEARDSAPLAFLACAHCHGREWAAQPTALVVPAGAECGARLVAQDLLLLSTNGVRRVHLETVQPLRCGAAAAGASTQMP